MALSSSTNKSSCDPIPRRKEGTESDADDEQQASDDATSTAGSELDARPTAANGSGTGGASASAQTHLPAPLAFRCTRRGTPLAPSCTSLGTRKRAGDANKLLRTFRHHTNLRNTRKGSCARWSRGAFPRKSSPSPWIGHSDASFKHISHQSERHTLRIKAPRARNEAAPRSHSAATWPPRGRRLLGDSPETLIASLGTGALLAGRDVTRRSVARRGGVGDGRWASLRWVGDVL